MDGGEYFEDSHHALATGMILGVLLRGDQKSDDDMEVKVVKPFMDSSGNYTNQILVRVAGKEYTITVDPSISEAMR